MLVDAPGSPDGVTVNEYAEGEVYEVTADLGAVFLAEGFAEVTDEDDVTYVLDLPPLGSGGPQDDKQAPGPQENK